MESNLIADRQIRVFISSTFKDMENERDYLINKVFPELRAKAAKRDVSLIELDLRWGIQEDEAKNGKVIEICLNEIENSHPFFIGLLGDRYGWQPTVEEIERNINLKERYPWLIEDLNAGLSVTEIEMQYGVLRNETNLNASFFIKKSLQSVNTGEDDKAKEKLENLKKAVMENKRYPYYSYATLEEIGSQIRGDFEALLDKYFPEQELSSLERERNAQRAILHSLCLSYIPVEKNYKVLDDFLHATDQSYICIAAKSGFGKSALLANWINHLENNDKYDIIYHFIGSSDVGVNYESVLKRFIDELCCKYTIELTEDEKKKDVVDLINDVLLKIHSDKTIVLVLDAVNQIHEANYAKQLIWIPTLPSNVKLVLTTLPDDDTFAAITRREIPIYLLEPLSRNNRTEMVNDYLKQYGKSLTDSQVSRIVDDSQNENTLALKTLLNQLIVFGRHEELDARINYYLEAESLSEFFQKVLQRAEEDYGYNLVHHALSLIAISRNGMSEKELVDIIGCLSYSWSQLYCAFLMHFNVRNGLVNFAHSYMRQAVIDRYFNDVSYIKSLRLELTDYFEGNEIPRVLDELPYQYDLLGERDKLHQFLLSLDHFRYLYFSGELAKYWLKLLDYADNDYSFSEYFDIIENSTLDDIDKAWYYDISGNISSLSVIDLDFSCRCHQRSVDIRRKVLGENDPETYRSYINFSHTLYYSGNYEKAIEYNLMSLQNYKDDGSTGNSVLATMYNNIAVAYNAQSDYDKALEYSHKALEILEQTSDANLKEKAALYVNMSTIYNLLSDNVKALEYLHKSVILHERLYGSNHQSTATSYNSMGFIYDSMGKYDIALDYYQKALEIRCKILGENHPETATSYDLIGDTYHSLQNYTKAMDYKKKALQIREKIFSPNHPDIAISYNSIGYTYDALGDYITALKYKYKALEIREKIFDENHTTIAVSYNSIGQSFIQLRDYENALDYFYRAHEINKKIYGENHESTASTYYNLGSVFYELESYDNALTLFHRALEILETIPNENILNIARSVGYIGACYAFLDNTDKAVEYYQKTISIYEQLVDEGEYGLLRLYARLGVCFCQLEKYAEAVRSLSYVQRYLKEDMSDVLLQILSFCKEKIGE